MVDLAIDKICRVCLQADPCLLPLFEVKVNNVDAKTLPDMISECINQEVSQNDGYPQRICNECIGRTRSAYDFKKLYEASHRTLTAYLASVKYSTKDECELELAHNECAEETNPLLHSCEDIVKSETKDIVKTEISGSDSEFEAENSHKKAQNECIEIEELIIKEEAVSDMETEIDATTFAKGLLHKKSSEIESELEDQPESIEGERTEVYETEWLEKVPLNSDKPFQCDKCQKLFKTNWRLTQHKRIHLKLKPHQCTVCDKKFTRRDSLTVHMSKHEGLFKCDLCHSSCGKEYVLKRHKFTVHGIQDSTSKVVLDDTSSASSSTSLANRIFECDQCHKKFKMKAHLKRHHISCHEGNQKLSCSECGKVYPNELSLRKHVGRHSGQHKCDQCTKTFLWLSELRLHQRIHKNERPFQCDICPKKYTRQYALKTHMLINHRKSLC